MDAAQGYMGRALLHIHVPGWWLLVPMIAEMLVFSLLDHRASQDGWALSGT